MISTGLHTDRAHPYLMDKLAKQANWNGWSQARLLPIVGVENRAPMEAT